MHAPSGTPTTGNAGLLGLEHEISETATADLIDAVSLLIELPPILQAVAWPRLRLSVWELHRRLAEDAQVAA
jgi:hypothetical protein